MKPLDVRGMGQGLGLGGVRKELCAVKMPKFPGSGKVLCVCVSVCVCVCLEIKLFSRKELLNFLPNGRPYSTVGTGWTLV